MDYALLIYANGEAMAAMTPEAIEQHADLMARWLKDATDRGIMRSGAPLHPTSVATSVQVREGKTLTTDGPFLETKEALAGFFILDCADLDDVITWAAKLPGAYAGTIEIRPVWNEMEEAMAQRNT